MFKKIVLGGLALLCILGGIFIHNKIIYVGEEVDPLTYFDEFNKNTNNLVYEDIRIDLDEPAKLIDGQVFVRYEFANQYVSDTIFYDEAEKVLTLTNVREVVRLYEGENQITFAGVSGNYILKLENEGLYISANLLEELFGVTVEQGSNERLFIATNNAQEQKIAVTKKKASLRTHAREKSTVIEQLGKGERVYVYSEEEGFVRVRSEQGIVGFLPSSEVKDEEIVDKISIPEVEQWEINPLKETVKLVWDQVSTKSEKDWTKGKYAAITNINVIAPTWFSFGDEVGTLEDRGLKSYVDAAHNRGIQVWPILSHNFENTGLTKTILSSTNKRQYVIDQVIQYARTYGFDGINIDIENIQTETSDVWVQFMRELYPQLKAQGLIVSVDVYMPSEWSNHYEREKVAASSDYFMVMAYDQHWSGSEEAGSVSEIPWVENGIQKNLEEVPKEKLVLGIPFYTRLWIERSNGLNVKSYSMASIQEVISSWGVLPIYDEASGQNYVEHVQEDGIYKVWLEDYESISKRIALMEKYELAGYGAWRLGYETSDIWDILKKVE
ncbi:MAG: hypothetical protein H9872_10285 [Candidatus Cellulosilyticum pullistercoris]|uniref:GH18 domain-containing protein n=1 Tax=Candidatus Cellulosilyticum pullistercoris TaxID=2838521 RepID=A0A9E2NP68_9FIRM|nr:hypothetical protein [Candidatus Cellulosilyticum pullistercoris]